MSDIKWIKIVTDIFDDEKILLIEALPARDSIITIWFKLLCFAGKSNNNGVFLMNDRVAYTDEMLATIFRRDLNTVRLAISTFKSFGMIEIVDDVITIPNWSKHQSLDAYEKKKERDREYQKMRRNQQKALITEKKSSDKSPDCNTTSSSDTSPDASADVASLEEDKEEDKDIDKDIKRERINYQKIIDMYNTTCVSYPEVCSLSESRKKAIKARLKKYSLEDLKQVFTLAEESDFMKGSNNRNWVADFDWMLKDANIVKILEGKYTNKEVKNNANRVRPDISRDAKPNKEPEVELPFDGF